MHFLTILTIIISVLLLVAVVLGLHAKTEKYVTYGLVLSRILVFALLALTIYLTLANSFHALWLGILRIMWQFLTLLLLESSFRRKRQTFGSPRLTSLSIMAVVLIIILALI